MSRWSGSRVIVVGLGVSGMAAARALARLGADVRVTEAASSPELLHRAAQLEAMGCEVETGGHDLARVDADMAVVSPGIPLHSDAVRALLARGIEVIGEVELAYRLSRCDFLAVTGTNGKTTTTTLLGTMLEESGTRSMAAGNIGVPLVDAVAAIQEGGAIAVEVSSFQLATAPTFRPRVAVLLNVAEDHTDWHGSLQGYVEAKARVVANQTSGDVFLPNSSDPIAMDIAARARSLVVPFSATALPPGGIGVAGGRVVWRGEELFGVDDVPLAGDAGLEDAVAAAGAALEYGIEPDAVLRALKGFRPLHHRLQVVQELDGVTYINDSKATNPHATLAAVKGLSDVVLIAGGRSKGIDLSPLSAAVPPVHAVIALGEAADEVAGVFSGLVDVEKVGSMQEAVAAARARARPGGSVLLAPGCASLDMYPSYAHRGDDFAAAVRSMSSADEKVRGE
jgi:UDP-N-acetylmuramoylalanine--D-glutamate ligase